MSTTIPTYPPTAPDLLRLLLERERARLLGPTVTHAVINDETRAAEAAQIAALDALDFAKGWVELKAMLSSHEGCSDVD